MKAHRRTAVLLSVLLLLGAACSSDPDEAGDDGGGDSSADDGPLEGSTVGLTDDTIKIGYLGADFGSLAEIGLAPDLGNQELIVQSVVDELNDNGGIGGRQIELKLLLVDGTAGPEVGQSACIEMTDDFGAFAVILGPAMSRDVARCTAVTKQTLTMNSTGFDEALYEEAEGRLFSTGSDTSMSTDRQYEGWARLLEDAGELDGKTIGVITAEQSPEFPAAVETGLLPTLEELGHEVAVNVNLPCAEGDRDCDQHESAIQQMKAAGVDFVFMAAPTLVGPAVVQAAVNLDFHPQWSANGNQVTDTVAQFFEGVKDEWDGAIGVSTVFAQIDDLSDEAHACNDIITERSGEDYEPGSDAFGFASVNCITMQMLQRATEEIDPAEVNQATVIRGIEGLGEVPLNAGPSGTISADKHNAGDYLFLADYNAADQRDYKVDPGVYAAETYLCGEVLEHAAKAIGGKLEDKNALNKALHEAKVPDTLRGPVSFDKYGNVVGNIFIRKVEKKGGKLVNTVVKTYPDVSQFWTYNVDEFLKNPVYSRDYPPAKNLEN